MYGVMVERTLISSLLQKILLVPMVALWAFHLYQRRFKEAATRKRIATLALTMVLIAAWVAAWVFSRYGISDAWLFLVAGLAVAVVVWQRKLMLPYRLMCLQCGKPLSITLIFSRDSNKCEACEPASMEGDRPR
jgi:hypothetical protein